MVPRAARRSITKYVGPVRQTSRVGLIHPPRSGNFPKMPVTEFESAEALEAAAGGDAKREYVQRIFSQIAPRYDLLNHLLSFNIDRRWRRLAIASLGWERSRAARTSICAPARST